MKFNVYKASEHKFKDDIEINTLEELLAWCKNIGHEIIINETQDSLTIYDDWVE